MKLSKWIGILAPSLYFFGVLIHGSHLASFGVYDFNQIEIRYVLIGATFIAITIAAFSVALIGLDISNPTLNFNGFKLLFWLQRNLAFVFFMWMLIAPFFSVDFRSIVSAQSNWVGFTINSALIYSISVVLIGFAMILRLIKRDSFIYNFSKVTVFIGIPLIIFSLYFLWGKMPLLADFFTFFGGVCIMTIAGMMGMADSFEGFQQDYLSVSEKEEVQGRFRVVVSMISLIVSVLLLTSFYAKYVYPALPQYIGGNQFRNAKIYFNSEVFAVEVIETASNWIYVLDEDGSVVQLNKDDISKIEWGRDQWGQRH